MSGSRRPPMRRAETEEFGTNVWVEVIGDDAPSGAGVTGWSLLTWLKRDPAVLQAGQAPTADAAAIPVTGTSRELINVIVANGIALGSLVVTVANWRAARASAGVEPPGVTVRRGNVEVAITSNTPANVRDVVATLLADEDDDEEPRSRAE